MRILHSADWHVDCARYGRLNSNTGIDTAIESNFQCLEHLVNVAVENEVDAFIGAGDMTNDGNPKPEIDLRLTETLQPLIDNEIPIELDAGNHERISLPSRHRDNIAILQKMMGSSYTNAVSDTALTKYPRFEALTIPYPSKSRILAELGKTRVDPTEGDALVVQYVQEQVYRLLENRDDTLPLVVVGHFTVSGIGLPGSERDVANLFSEVVFPTEFFNQFDPSYVALGHIHTPQKIQDNVYYSGSLNKLTFTDANDTKGGLLVDIDDATGKLQSVENIETPVRGMYKIDLEDEGVELDLDNYQADDCVLVKLETGEKELPREIRKEAKERRISLYPDPRKKSRTTERKVMSSKVAPFDALKTYLESSGLTQQEIEGAVTRAKIMGIEGANDSQEGEEEE